jgi:dihydrofolate reductase
LRKLIYAINVTIDGFADHTAVIADDELHDFYTNLFDINSINKIVFSKTLNEVGWNNTRLIKDNIVKEVSKLKHQPGKNLAVGGISTPSIFMKHGLIDEYWFLVQPIIAGSGRSLFENLNDRIDLRLFEIKKFKSGVVVHHYKK